MDSTSPFEKVHLAHAKASMLFTLYGKAVESREKKPILPDPWAEAAVARIDYDFAKFRVRKYETQTIALRSKQFDFWTAGYLAQHPSAVVLHLGCGLDSRVYRVDPPAGVLWYDVDYPDVIEARQRLFPQRPGYTLIGSSLEDLDWLESVPADRPVLVVAEGVTQYLSEEIMKALLNRVTGHFASGQIVFDAYSLRLVQRMASRRASVKGSGAASGWGIDNPAELKLLDPRLELVLEAKTSDFVAFAQMPFTMRAVIRVMDFIPTFRDANRGLIYRF
jgi:O-methyltransferase involved in polyketide biosynthesis